MVRLYLNLTNKCTQECPFCCMYSGKDKNIFMSFEKFKEIIDASKDDFELQLEGGEPLLHPDLYLFLEYSKHTYRCKKIIITTNGDLLRSHIVRLVDFHKNYGIPVFIKISINYWLLKNNKNLLKMAQDYNLATEFIKGFDIRLNVRLRNDIDEWIRERISSKKLNDIANIYYLQRYGRYSDELLYDLPTIVQNIDDWFIYSCDGVCFNKDLLKRSEYEGSLI